MMPTSSRPKKMALGTLRSGSSTSSAMEPAALETQERPADERDREQHGARCPGGGVGDARAREQRRERVLPEEDQQHQAQPDRADDLAGDARDDHDLQYLAADHVDRAADRMIRTATARGLPPARFGDPEDLEQESARRVRQRAERERQAPHVGPRGGPAPRGPADVPRPLVDAAGIRPARRQLTEHGRNQKLAREHDRERPEESGPAANRPSVKIA